MAMVQTTMSPGQSPPWTDFAVFTAYTAGTLIAATQLLRRRDA